MHIKKEDLAHEEDGDEKSERHTEKSRHADVEEEGHDKESERHTEKSRHADVEKEGHGERKSTARHKDQDAETHRKEDDKELVSQGHDGEDGHTAERSSQQSNEASQHPWDGAVTAAGGAWNGFLTGAKNLLHVPTETTTITGSTTRTTTETATITTTKTITRTATSTSTETSTSTTKTATITTTATSTSTTSSTKLATLFCFEVVRTTGFEPHLVKGQYENKASIFACEEYSLYSHGGTLQVGPVTSAEIPAPEVIKGNLSKAGTTTSSWLNTMIFMETWKLILAENKWWNHAWTVKVDPDAVFFPHRLKVKLYPYYPAGITDGPALFVGNCDRSWNNEPTSLKLFGSLEVFSRNAMGMYKAFSSRCKKKLDWEGWGEDFFMQNCLQMLEVKMLDGVDFIGDNRCYGAPCSDTTKVAFHAYKDTQEYFDCWGESRAAEGLVDVQ